MAHTGWNVLLIFLLFQGALSAHFNLPRVYEYWDEAFFLTASALSLVKGFGRKIYIIKNKANPVIPWILLVGIGLLGNVRFHYSSSYGAVVRDIVGFLKFPITFYAVRRLGWDGKAAEALQNKGFLALKFLTVIICILGVLSQFYDWGMTQTVMRYGILPYRFLFSHPTDLVYAASAMLCLFCADEKQGEYWGYHLMLIATIILTMRTKGLAFAAVYIFMKYGGAWLKKYKILYLTGIFLIAFAAGYSKLQVYASWSSSGREVLWTGAFTLMRICFPIGSGFATYASHLSGRYRSLVYNFIYSYDFWTSEGGASSVLGDTGFPYYMGQFGIMGLLILAKAVLQIFRTWNPENGEGNYRGLAENLLSAYIAISLTTEALLITYGVELAVILAVIIKTDEMGRT